MELFDLSCSATMNSFIFRLYRMWNVQYRPEQFSMATLNGLHLLIEPAVIELHSSPNNSYKSFWFLCF